MTGLSVVERVARGICEACGYDPDAPVDDARAEWQMFITHAKAALEASHHAELVEMLRRLRDYPSVRCAIGDEFLADVDALLAKIGGDA